MTEWKCSRCGYTNEGRCRPKKCPECNADKGSFLKS